MEREEIIQKMNEVVMEAKGIPADCSEIYDNLVNSKKFFIDSFGGFIYEFPEEVTFNIGEKVKNSKVVDFCTHLENKYGLFDLSEFLYAQKEGFFKNKVSKEYVTVRGAIIKPGAKLLKAFKYFIESEEMLRKIQDEASLVIQEDKLKGKLCLSVHPLDFLSLSENDHNWRSCHALDGEFCAGNFSYMQDECTCIAYLKSSDGDIHKLPRFPESVPWNSKKWRVLLFLSDHRDMLFAGRQYPFYADSGIDIVLDMIRKYLPALGEWTNWQSDKIRDWKIEGKTIPLRNEYIGIGNKLVSLQTLIKDYGQYESLHFNDLLKSSCYDPVYSYKKQLVTNWRGEQNEEIITGNTTRFVVGSEVKCPCCKNKKIELSELLSCTDCEIKYGNSDSEMFTRCACCGSRYLYDDGYFLEYEEVDVCPDCYDRYCDSCELCGMTAYADGGGLHYDERTGRILCYVCSSEEE